MAFVAAPIAAKRQSGITLPFASALDSTQDLDDASFGKSGSRLVCVIEIDNKDYNTQVPGLILGYSKRGGNGKMSRQLPWRHPIWTWFYASEISSIKGMGYISSNSLGFNQFQRYQLTVVFTTLPYDVMTDAQTTTEDQRFVDYLPAPRTDMVALDSGQFIVADPAAPGSIDGNPVRANVGIRLPKVAFKYRWYDVPRNYILNANYFPVNLAAAIGTINSDEFRGMDVGTLLSESMDLTPTTAVVSPGTMFGADTTSTNPRTYTVDVNLLWWSPTTTSTTKGWNLYPAADRNFYFIQTENGSQPQYQSTAFANIWKPV